MNIPINQPVWPQIDHSTVQWPLEGPILIAKWLKQKKKLCF